MGNGSRLKPHPASARLAGAALILALAILVALPALAQQPARRWRHLALTELTYVPPRSIAFDADGSVYIGGTGGVNILRPEGRRAGNAVARPEASVVAITVEADGAIWLATDASAGQTAGVRVILPDGRQADFGEVDGLADSHVRDLLPGLAGDVWFATAGGLAHRSAGGSWGRFTAAEGLTHDDTYALALDAQGNLWVGTLAGISRLSPDGEWLTYGTDDGLANVWAYDLAIDGSGALWCATPAGLSVLEANDRWQTKPLPDDAPTAHVNALAADGAGGLWLATDAGALYRSAAGEWTRIAADQAGGLPSDQVTAVALDLTGRPWFTTPAGVSALLEGLPVAPVAATVRPPTSTATATALAADAGTPAAPHRIVGGTPFSSLPSVPIVQGESRMSQTAFVAVFFAILGLALIGVVFLTVRIIARARARHTAGNGQPKAMAAAAPLMQAPVVEEVLSPARLSADENLPPEVEAALAELDRYTPHPDTPRSSSLLTAVSPIPPEPHVPLTRQAPAEEVGPAASADATPSMAEMARLTPALERSVLEARLHSATIDDVPALMGEGTELARAGRKAAAYDVFSAVTRLVPNHVEAWLWKGGTALHPQEAVRCLRKAVELDPDNQRAREGLNWALSYLAVREDQAGATDDAD